MSLEISAFIGFDFARELGVRTIFLPGFSYLFFMWMFLLFVLD